MVSLVHCQWLDNEPGIQSQAAMPKQMDASKVEVNFPSFFSTIPPERVGLNGEYDHSGLAKRVECSFRQCFQPAQLEQLQVAQRGRVVILKGAVRDRDLLNQLVASAQRVFGASDVETCAVKILERSCSDAACITYL